MRRARRRGKRASPTRRTCRAASTRCGLCRACGQRVVAGILRGQPAKGGPIEMFAALGKQAQKSIMQEASQRHGNPKGLGSRERQADVLVAKRCREGGWLELTLGDEAAVGLVRR